jgi:signal transduction histidine kinase
MMTVSRAMVRDVWDLFDVFPDLEQGGIEQYIARVLKRCCAWFAANSASAYLRRQSTEHFDFVAGTNSLGGTSFAVGEGIAGIVAESGQPVLVNDPAQHPLLRSHGIRRRQSIGSAIVLPFLAPSGECVGIVNLTRKAGQPEFTSDDLEQMQSVVKIISLAVANARLIDALHQAQRNLDSLVRNLPVAVIVLDKSGAVVASNPAAHQLFVNFETLTTQWPNLTQVVQRAAEEEGRLRVDGARAFWVRSRRLELGQMSITIEETTEHDHAMTEMSRLSRLAEIGQMSAAIAHEIRNPLTGIRGAAQLIASDPESAPELGAMIEEEVDKLNGLCEEFLDFSRPLSLRLGEAKMSEIIQPILDLHAKDFSDRGVSVSLQICDDEPTLTLDSLRVEQALRNLVRNALQASKPGGRIEITVTPGEVSVTDFGTGMTDEQVRKLFIPFFTTKADGTGLGLSTTRKIVDAHRATIDVVSAPNQGSTFTIRFPESNAA